MSQGYDPRWATWEMGWCIGSPRPCKINVNTQSNQIGELVAVIAAAETTPGNWALEIITDSKYVIEGLTNYLRSWEDNGWIGIQNAHLFKRAAYLLKRRSAIMYRGRAVQGITPLQSQVCGVSSEGVRSVARGRARLRGT
jgi:hypothetical protein